MNAVFFDMDGTLIDSKADLAATVNHTRRDLGLSERPMDEVIANVGRGAQYLLEKSIPECVGENAVKPIETAKLKELFFSHYAEHMIETVQLYPAVIATLAELRSRGWMLGVNTNKPAFATRAILEKFGLIRFFGSAVVAGGDCAEMKPSVLTLRQCAARMNGHRLSSHDWMVGDSWQDMQCAANAGVKGAFCTFGFGQLGDSRYTVKINRFDEILRYLKAEE